MITFSISMNIMCVCLFSALSRRVGALQISIIIIVIKCMLSPRTCMAPSKSVTSFETLVSPSVAATRGMSGHLHAVLCSSGF